MVLCLTFDDDFAIMSIVNRFIILRSKDMDMTFDWLIPARNSPEFRRQIENGMICGQDIELTYNDMYRIIFKQSIKSVIVKPYSETSDFHCKIIPTRISYSAIRKILDDKFDSISESEIERLYKLK